MTKTFIWIGLFVGSTLGGLIPILWGDDMLSMWGILLSMVGAIVGIIAGYRVGAALG